MGVGEHVQIMGLEKLSGQKRRKKNASAGKKVSEVGQRKVLILFDLNGVLLHQTKLPGPGKMKRNFSIRRGVEHLVRLLPHFNLGVYSSATKMTVDLALERVIQAIHAAHKAAKQRTGMQHSELPKPLFSKIMYRDHTCRDQEYAQRADGKDWDTLKPLAQNGLDASGTLLVDDTPRKAWPGEERNMIVVPGYTGIGEESRPVLEYLVDHLIAFASNARDVRLISSSLQAAFETSLSTFNPTAPLPRIHSMPQHGLIWNGPLGVPGMPGGMGPGMGPGEVMMVDGVGPGQIGMGSENVSYEEDFTMFWKQSEMHSLLLDYTRTESDAVLAPLDMAQVKELEPNIDHHVVTLARAAMLILLTVPKGVPATEIRELIVAESSSPFKDMQGGAFKNVGLVLEALVKAGGVVEVEMSWLWSSLPPCYVIVPGFRHRNPQEAYLLRLLERLQEVEGVAVSQLKHFLRGFHPLLSAYFPAELTAALQKLMVSTNAAEYFKVPPEWDVQLRLTRKKTKCFLIMTDLHMNLEALQESIEALVSVHEQLLGKAPVQLSKRRRLDLPSAQHTAPTNPTQTTMAVGAAAAGGTGTSATQGGFGAGASGSGGLAGMAPSMGGGASGSGMAGGGMADTMFAAADSSGASWEMELEGMDGGEVEWSGHAMAPAVQPGRSAERLCPDELLEASCLHAEVLDFTAACLPEEERIADVMAALNVIEVAARLLWPQARAVAFGSQATGLALPGSDLDVVLLDMAGHELLTPAEGYSKLEKMDIARHLQTLMDSLRANGCLRRGALIQNARVPIIKCVLNIGPGLAADISVGTRNGAHAVLYVQQLLLEVPPMRPLCLLVKAFLKERGLNEVFQGGLSSWSLVNMVLAHLQCEGFELEAQPPQGDTQVPVFPVQELRALRQQDLGNVDLSWLLWAFFERYGNIFDYRNDAVSIMHGGVRSKDPAWVKAGNGKVDRFSKLCVEDPQQDGRDIAGGTYEIQRIVEAFKQAAAAMRPLLVPESQAPPAPQPLSWAAVQSEGTHQSVGGPGSYGCWRLNCILDVRLALEQSVEMHALRLRNHGTGQNKAKYAKKQKGKARAPPKAGPMSQNVLNRHHNVGGRMTPSYGGRHGGHVAGLQGRAAALGMGVQGGGVGKMSGYPQGGPGEQGRHVQQQGPKQQGQPGGKKKKKNRPRRVGKGPYMMWGP